MLCIIVEVVVIVAVVVVVVVVVVAVVFVFTQAKLPPLAASLLRRESRPEGQSASYEAYGGNFNGTLCFLRY